ncbi:MAG: sigma-70 family RNA polymerase sigma factor [Verrucomicrobiota bacterium]|nr:sigma-70 family RNA polymerase sigma factor [Verrucomicrobiota bacterium]
MTELGEDDSATRHYAPLYRFALSLTQTEADALDLVQQTFYLWAIKGHQLRDATKLKTWLFTTLYREHLAVCRRQKQFPAVALDVLEHEPVFASAETVERLDGDTVLRALSRLDEMFRAPLALFYLENFSYKQIAEMLGVPAGTVMSRLARAREQLRRRLTRELEPDLNPKPPQSPPNPPASP